MPPEKKDDYFLSFLCPIVTPDGDDLKICKHIVKAYKLSEDEDDFLFEGSCEHANGSNHVWFGRLVMEVHWIMNAVEGAEEESTEELEKEANKCEALVKREEKTEPVKLQYREAEEPRDV